MMRQLRVKIDSCSVRNIVSICTNDYSFFNEDKRSFQPGWINETTLEFNSSIQQAFQYQTGDQLGTYTYVGDYATYSSGGYVYEFRGRLSSLRSNLSQLHQLGWIDSQTRAVIIQFSLYNPNVNLFTSAILLTEFLSTSSLYPQSRFEPLSFQCKPLKFFNLINFLFLVFTSLSQVICAILYMIIIVYMMIEQIENIFHMKINYFHQFWSWIDLGIIGCSWTNVGIYVWRCHEFNRISNLFHDTNGFVYINLQLSVYINDIYTYLLGFCYFFGTLKFLRFARFHHRLSLFTKIIRQARNDLLSFTCMFAIIFLAFLSLFYLLFISKLWSCSNLLYTAQMLFQMMSNKFGCLCYENFNIGQVWTFLV